MTLVATVSNKFSAVKGESSSALKTASKSAPEMSANSFGQGIGDKLITLPHIHPSFGISLTPYPGREIVKRTVGFAAEGLAAFDVAANCFSNSPLVCGGWTYFTQAFPKGTGDLAWARRSRRAGLVAADRRVAENSERNTLEGLGQNLLERGEVRFLLEEPPSTEDGANTTLFPSFKKNFPGV
jgi:hypothetical protein